jgi:hypothetical protein
LEKKKKQKAKLEYGPEAAQGKMSETELDTAIILQTQLLQKSPEEIQAIERSTVGQGFNDEWKFQRRNRITASNCGRIFSLQNSTNNTSILKSLLSPTDISHSENIKYGVNNEPEAKRMFTFLNGLDVQECGLFISPENGILAASPDGLLGDDGILEVECVTCVPEKIPKRPDSFLIFKDKKNPSSGLMLKKTHKYYFQILMQLHVTKRKYCDLFVYHKPKDVDANIEYFQERILRDEETENKWIQVKEKLLKFYMSEMIQEICDPVFPATGFFRVPEYRMKAMEEKTQRASSKVLPHQQDDDLAPPAPKKTKM